ncbi:MAG: Transcriptional regulator, GntR family domain / Aspartate aminotransferase, partial [Bryobacterales bacterium]|nr:Transcriptional regulator, GntR family domain / Aspartate aminotransferase [Bryobacterales bacterium]
MPALQSLDAGSSVILIGSFSKLLFPSLRLGYVMLPESLVDYFVAFRFRTDLRSLNVDQAVLCDFITAGHLGRHLRRMRNIYAGRLGPLIEVGREYMQVCWRSPGFRPACTQPRFSETGCLREKPRPRRPLTESTSARSTGSASRLPIPTACCWVS